MEMCLAKLLCPRTSIECAQQLTTKYIIRVQIVALIKRVNNYLIIQMFERFIQINAVNTL